MPGPAAALGVGADLRRFHLLFRRAAFIPDASGKCFVARVADGLAGCAREISDKLKEPAYREESLTKMARWAARVFTEIGHAANAPRARELVARLEG